MPHPFAGKSQNAVGQSRAASMTSGYKRGGRTGAKININIHSNPQGENRALPPPLTPAALGPAAAMAPPGPSPVPGVMPGGGAPPMPPPGMKRGGRIAKAGGGLASFSGGAEGGVGRLEKAAHAKRARGG